jgi:hypothetical protein
MAEQPDATDSSPEDDGAESEDTDYSKMNALEVMQNLLAILADFQENGIPILFSSTVEEESEDGEHEYTAFTELRGIHLALKTQNKLLASGVQKLGEIADAVASLKKSSI